MGTVIESASVELLDDIAAISSEPQEVEEASDDLAEEFYPVDYSISYYGADYPVDGLVQRLDRKDFFLPPFQRSYVWNIYRASRFIESLLLGLPVPAIFLSREADSAKHVVIDGQQRLRTLQYFCSGLFPPTGREFKLLQVHPRFQERTYGTLEENDRRRLNESLLHAIIVKQDKPDEPGQPSSIYHIFERLNTGGVWLQPQELRSCVYHGPLINLLERLNENPNWRLLFGKPSARMRDRELILRFLAIYYEASVYSKPMKEFLNGFSKSQRSLDDETAKEFSERFAGTVEMIARAIGNRAFKTTRAVNAALCDAVMVGVAKRLEKGRIQNAPALKENYERLKADREFRDAISANTTDEATVQSRLRCASAAFRDVP